MAAAIAACRNRKTAGREIVILEKKDRIGKKILVTGNGKCNLTNLSFSSAHPEDYYRGENTEKLRTMFEHFGPEDTLLFFRRMGMLTMEKNGYVYPLSQQASTVLDTLRFELERLQVETVVNCRIINMKRFKNGEYEVKSIRTDGESEKEEIWHFEKLILACGSPAGQKTGEGSDGYAYARAFGHRILEPMPALVQLRCGGDFWKQLAGVRTGASVTLTVRRKGKPPFVCREQGELQLTDYGISGIPVFQLSRYASCALAAGGRVQAEIDFLPDFENRPEEWNRWIRERLTACTGRSMEELFCGLIHKKIIQVLQKQWDLRTSDRVSDQNRDRILGVFQALRGWKVEVTAANPLSSAQVCAGGVPFSQVSDRLESVLCPGLYFCGELLDTDGRCGGYNLQWAWTSGHIAGEAAAGAAGWYKEKKEK